MENPDVNERTKQLREKYAQENLILFLPFRTKSDLLSTHDDTYWTSFTSEKKDLIWKKGFDIMENIQNTFNLKKLSRLPDKLTAKTKCKTKDTHCKGHGECDDDPDFNPDDLMTLERYTNNTYKYKDNEGTTKLIEDKGNFVNKHSTIKNHYMEFKSSTTSAIIEPYNQEETSSENNDSIEYCNYNKISRNKKL